MMVFGERLEKTANALLARRVYPTTHATFFFENVEDYTDLAHEYRSMSTMGDADGEWHGTVLSRDINGKSIVEKVPFVYVKKELHFYKVNKASERLAFELKSTHHIISLCAVEQGEDVQHFMQNSMYLGFAQKYNYKDQGGDESEVVKTIQEDWSYAEYERDTEYYVSCEPIFTTVPFDKMADQNLPNFWEKARHAYKRKHDKFHIMLKTYGVTRPIYVLLDDRNREVTFDLTKDALIKKCIAMGYKNIL